MDSDLSDNGDGYIIGWRDGIKDISKVGFLMVNAKS